MIRQINFICCSLINKTGLRTGRAMLRSPAVMLAAILIVACSLSGCSNQLTEQERLVPIPKQAWEHAYRPWVHLDILDSTLHYRIYAVVRHIQAFKYDNLLLRYGYIAPGDSAVFHEVNLPLAKSNKWLGDTLGTIVETRIRLASVPRKLPVGDNAFVLEHLMPDEPLTGLVQVGIRIEAAEDGMARAAAPAQKSAPDSLRSVADSSKPAASRIESTK